MTNRQLAETVPFRSSSLLARRQSVATIIDFSRYLEPKRRSEALARARAIQNPVYRLDALVQTLPYLAEDERHIALTEATALAIGHPDRLGKVAPFMTMEQRAKAFASLLKIEGERRLAIAVSELAPYLSARQCNLIASTAANLLNDFARARILIACASHLTARQRANCIATIRKVKNELNQAGLLYALAEQSLSETEIAKVLSIVRSISSEEYKSAALIAIIPRLTLAQQRDEALVISSELRDSETALRALAPHLSARQLNRAVRIAYSITDPIKRAFALAGLVPYISEGQRAYVAESAIRLIEPNDEPYVTIILEIAPYFKDFNLKEVLSTAAAISPSVEFAWASLIGEVASRLDEQQVTQVFEASFLFEGPHERAAVLEALNVRLSPVQIQMAVTAAYTSPLHDRAILLCGIADRLDSNTLSDLLVSVRDVRDERLKSSLLIRLAPHFSKNQKSEAVAIAWSMDDDFCRAETLGRLDPYLIETDQSDALISNKNHDQPALVGDRSKRGYNSNSRQASEDSTSGVLAQNEGLVSNAFLEHRVLPEHPPRLWTPPPAGRPPKGVSRDRELIAFIRDVYGIYLRKASPQVRHRVRAYIFKRDSSLYRAIVNYEKRAGKHRKLPRDIDMPSEPQLVDERFKKATRIGLRSLNKPERRSVAERLLRMERRGALDR